MAGPGKVGPSGGPLSGGMEASQDFANQYNKAAQAKQAEIARLAKELGPKENAKPEPQRGQENQKQQDQER